MLAVRARGMLAIVKVCCFLLPICACLHNMACSAAFDYCLAFLDFWQAEPEKAPEKAGVLGLSFKAVLVFQREGILWL